MLRRTTRLAATVFVAIACAAPATLAEDAAAPADMEAVMHLMELSGSANMGGQMIDQVMASFQQTMPDVPQSFWDAYRAEIDMNELVQLIAPVYAKHFTNADIEALTQFYESPVGRKLVSVQPMIFEESMSIGQTYSQSVTLKLMEKLKADGYTDL